MKNIKRYSGNKSAGLSIKIAEQVPGGLSSGLLTSIILFVGIILTFFSMLQISVSIWWSCGLGILFLLLLQFLDHWKKQVWIAALLIFIAGLILTAVQMSYISDGFILLVNRLIEQSGRHFGVTWNLYEVTVNQTAGLLCEAFCLCVISLAAAMLIRIIVYSRNNYLLFIVTVPLLILQIGFGWGVHSVAVLILLFGIFLMINHAFISVNKREAAGGKSQGTAGIQMFILMTVIYLTAWLGYNLLFPPQTYQKNKVIQGVSQSIKNLSENLRYEKQKTNSLPQGQFTGLGNLELSDQTALKVVMDKPASLYMRGFVGSKYTSQGFKSLDYDTYYDSRDLFYWLHDGEFNGMSQLYQVSALENGEEEVFKVDLSIYNVNANSKYIYNTYGMITDPQLITDAQDQGDETLRSKGFWGSRYYRYQAAGGLVRLYPQIASDFYSMKDNEVMVSYSLLESNYNEDVYKKYTEVPEEVKKLLKVQLETEGRKGKDHYPYEDANAVIMQYLNDNIVYSEEVETYDGSIDFLTYFMERSSTGYSVHYAAAATMMYRYLGIPARYVEGYLIMPDDIEDAEAYQELEIAGDHAHAWVEIYQDGIGWIPMEVTPPYLDKMDRPEFELAASASGEDESGGSGGSAGEEEDIEDDEDPLKKKEAQEERSRQIKKILLIIVIVLLLVLLLAVLGYIINGRRKLKIRLAGLESDNCAEAVCHMYEYLMLLLHYNGLPEAGGSRYRFAAALDQQYSQDMGTEYEKTVTIVQEAAYSSHTITREHCDEVNAFMLKVKETTLKSKNPVQRFRMRFWDFIY